MNKLKNTSMKEFEMNYCGYCVTIKEDNEYFYIDFNTGLGEGLYQKADWTLESALKDQLNIDVE